MPVTGTVLSNLDNLVFNKGFMYGTITGNASDAIAFGALQNVRMTHTFTKVEIRGPESLSPLGVGISEENLTGTWEYGVAHPEQFIMFLGGSIAYNAGTGRTTYTKTINQEPGTFNLHFVSQSGANPDVEIYLYRCVVEGAVNIQNAENRAFTLGSGGFRCYGQAASDGGVLFTYSRPGDLTNSS